MSAVGSGVIALRSWPKATTSGQQAAVGGEVLLVELGDVGVDRLDVLAQPLALGLEAARGVERPDDQGPALLEPAEDLVGDPVDGPLDAADVLGAVALDRDGLAEHRSPWARRLGGALDVEPGQVAGPRGLGVGDGHARSGRRTRGRDRRPSRGWARTSRRRASATAARRSGRGPGSCIRSRFGKRGVDRRSSPRTGVRPPCVRRSRPSARLSSRTRWTARLTADGRHLDIEPAADPLREPGILLIEPPQRLTPGGRREQTAPRVAPGELIRVIVRIDVDQNLQHGRTLPREPPTPSGPVGVLGVDRSLHPSIVAAGTPSGNLLFPAGAIGCGR